MKKFLSLMLAMIMVMSLVTVGAGAAFTDEETIQYNEAVAVMSELGILGGYTDGSFRPQGTLTRQVAAKIIAYIALGTKEAEKLICVEDPFSDMAANKTLAPYVNWVAKEGIVTGYDDGTFAPTANVSGHAFLKMVLGALKIKGTYEGEGWRVNVTSAAAEAGLFEGIDTTAINLRADATRELACQIAFNAMFYSAEAVSYEIYDENDEVIATAATEEAANIILAIRDGARYWEEVKDPKATLAYKNFDVTAVEPKNGGVDQYGRPATVYTFGDENDTIIYAIEAPVYTYTNTKTEKALFTALGKAGYQGADDRFVLISESYTDGKSDELNGTATKNTVTGKYDVDGGKVIQKNDGDNSYGANGATVEIYATEKANVFTAVITNEYLAKVTKVVKADEEAGDARYVEATVYTGLAEGVTTTLTEKKFETEEFAKNNYVLVTLKWDGDSYEVDTMKAATETKDVALEKFKTTSNVTIDGKTVKYSAKFSKPTTDHLSKGAFDTTFNTTYSYYTDSQGNILAIKEYFAAVNNYVYVNKVQAQEYDENDLLGSGKEAMAVAEVIFVDGTKKVVDLKITKETDGTYTYDKPVADGSVTEGAAVATAADPINTWFAYKANEDGTYTLVALADSASTVRVATLSSDLALEKGVAKKISGSRWTNSNTVVYSIDTNGAVTKATGLVKAELDADAAEILYTWNSSNNVTAIYAIKQAAIMDAIASDYVYAVSAGSTVKDGIEWKFYDEGAEKTYVINAVEGNGIAKGDIFTLSTVDGKITAKEITTNVEKQATVTRIDEAFILVTLADGETVKDLYLTADTAVYNATEKGVADELEKDDVVTLLYNSDNELVVAYITVEADA